MTTATAASAATSLRDLLRQEASRQTIADFMNGLSGAARVEEALSLGGSEVARLYRAVAGGRELLTTDFVPSDTPPNGTIIFEGRNSLPLFSRFQKRFAKLPSGQVVGYNHQSMSVVTGPGFFVVQPATIASDVPGELYFDYTAAPESVPEGWPPYKPNDAGLSTLVYKHMKDYMREVANNVYVGEAYKLGKSQKQFFLLARDAG